MKSLLVKLGVILMSVVIFYPYNTFAEIEIKYDRFKNNTVVQTSPKTLTAGTPIKPILYLIGGYDGQTPSRPALCVLGFASISPNWKFLRCHSLYCLADGNPVELPPSKHSGNVGKSYVLERISAMVPFSIIEQLSKCEKVEFKICNTEFALSKDEIEDLKTFVEAFFEKK
jgi:hypothetical protein